MRIIKIWYLHVQPAEYSTDYRTGSIVHNWYNDYDDLYLYSADEAMQTFREYADDYKKTWEKYGEQIGYPSDVCVMYALLVPVRDDVTLPNNAGDLFLPVDTTSYDPMYLDVESVDIVPEFEFPQAEQFRTLFEDGEITYGNGRTDDPRGYLPRWKSRGWDGEVTTA